MKNLSLYFSLAISTSIPACLDNQQSLAGDQTFADGKADVADDKADDDELAFYSIDKKCTGTTCSLGTSTLNGSDTVAITGVNWPATHSDEDLQRIDDSLYGARVIVRGSLVLDGTKHALEVTETWLAATGGFILGTPTYTTLQPVRTFCPGEPCPKKYAQGVLNGERLDDVEIDLSTLPVDRDELATIQAQLDGDGIIALGSETGVSGAKRFIVARAYLPIL